MPRLRALADRGIISKEAVAKLGAMSIQSVEDLLYLTCTDFTGIVSRTGISGKELNGIVHAVSREFGSLPQSASLICNRWKERSQMLETGSERLDELLTGGFFTGEITELVGPCATGKTQAIAKALYGADETDQAWEADLQRLRVYPLADANNLLWELVRLEQRLEQASDPFFRTLKLIIVDSIGSIFAPIIGGPSNVGHSLLVSVVQTLQRISSTFHISIVVTNHTTSGVNAFQQHQPALGDTWSHLACVSLALSTPDDDEAGTRRIAQVRKSNKNRTLAAAEFRICGAGVTDWQVSNS